MLILVGCFSGPTQDDGWIVRGWESLPEPAPQYKSNNAQKGDTRVWCHSTQTQHQRVLVCSPDTNVFNIGITMAAQA